MNSSNRWIPASVSLLMLSVGLAPACAEDDAPKACVVATQANCEAGLRCEVLTSGGTGCFAPIRIRGTVLNASDSVGIGGATVVAVNADGSPVSATATTAADGTYSLVVPTERTEAGEPDEPADVTLRADAAGFLPFPKAPRSSVPIELTGATKDTPTVASAATTVALIERPAAAWGRIDGTVAFPAGFVSGTLVVATQGGQGVGSAVTDASGAFVLFDVPAGATAVTGYAAGLNVSPQTVAVMADSAVSVALTATSEGLTRVEGSVSIVNAPGGSITSVILVPEATFDATALRGEAPPGLVAKDVTGAFSIAGVPPGTYIALAAFPNDGLVRDPDTTIGGTSLVSLTVVGDAAVVSIPESFKVTGALATISPGADRMENVSVTPELVWEDDSSEDGYELHIYDTFGVLAYEALDIQGVSGSDRVTHTPAGLTLIPGMIYQFKAKSWREKKGARTYISATEDLQGVFIYTP